MSRSRRLGHVLWLAAITHGCSVVSDFRHLDDGQGARGDGAGSGAASGTSTGSSAPGGGGRAATATSSTGGAGGLAGTGGSGGSGGRDCKTAIADCTSTDECCGELQCLMTTAGVVCCGLTGEPCVTTGGEDCCIQRECRDDATGEKCTGGICHCQDM